MKEDLLRFQQPVNPDKVTEIIKTEPTSQTEIIDSNFSEMLQFNLQEIERLEKIISNTNISLNQTREKLGIPASNEIPPSILQAKDKLVELREFSRRYHHPEYRTKIATELKEARSSGNVETVQELFYARTSEEKDMFESRDSERDIAKLMKEKDILFLHSMAFLSAREAFSVQNQVIDTSKIGFEDRIRIIEGAEPTISVSVPAPDRNYNGLLQRSGIVLGGGKVLSAKDKDSFSTALGLYKRMSGTQNEEHEHSAIQPKINVESVIPRGGKQKEIGAVDYNELIVESPEVAGLYYDLTVDEKEFDANIQGLGGSGSEDERRQRYEMEIRQERKLVEKEFEEMGKKSKQMNVPLYAIRKQGNKIEKYRVDFIANPGDAERYIEEVLRPKGKQISEQYGNDSEEFKRFVNKEYNPAMRAKNSTPYNLTPVSAEQILDLKPRVSREERAKFLEDLISKNIFSNPDSLREAKQKLRDLKT